MRIAISAQENGEPGVELTDDELDNSNFVDIEIEVDGEEGEVLAATVPLDELAAAVEAFLMKRKLTKERDA